MSLAPWEDIERIPNLDREGEKTLRYMVEHPCAPAFTNRSGHHLSTSDIQRLQQFDSNEAVRSVTADFLQSAWLTNFVDHCLTNVPFYRRYLKELPFQQIPTISRSDLSTDIAQFVPDELPIDRLITYETSGTTGHALKIPSHPEVAARYSCFHKKALCWNGIDTQSFASDIAVILAGYQKACFTYVSLVPYLQNKGLAKLNFHPSDWQNPDDRCTYIDEMRPDLLTGDPISLHELTQLEFSHQPKAVLSTSMTLMPAQKESFSLRFGCPVLDVYSMNEAGPVATSVPDKKGLRLLQSGLYVEILGRDEKPLPTGEFGEIVLTGGFNTYLPLLRYRTGDYGRLEKDSDGFWYLRDLEGRPPVRFRTESGEWLNNVDITHALQSQPLAQFTLHQRENGHLKMKVHGQADIAGIKRILEKLFGVSVKQTVEADYEFLDKVIQYSSDLTQPSP